MRKTLICILALLMLLSSCLVACGGEDNNSIGDASKPSKGLEYALNEDGNSYSVTGIGDCTDAHLVIPSTTRMTVNQLQKLKIMRLTTAIGLKVSLFPIALQALEILRSFVAKNLQVSSSPIALQASEIPSLTAQHITIMNPIGRMTSCISENI